MADSSWLTDALDAVEGATTTDSPVVSGSIPTSSSPSTEPSPQDPAWIEDLQGPRIVINDAEAAPRTAKIGFCGAVGREYDVAANRQVYTFTGGEGGESPSDDTPATCTAATGTAGEDAEYSRGDHRHQISVGSPVSVGSANADGDSSSLARANHVHAHGNQAGGSLHAVATTSVAGFESAADKQIVDAAITSLTSTDSSVTITGSGHSRNLAVNFPSANIVVHSVRLIQNTNVDIASPSAVMRGITLSAGDDRIFLCGQHNPIQNGLYLFNGAGVALTRESDWSGTINFTVPHMVLALYASDTYDVDTTAFLGGPGGTPINYTDRGGLWISCDEGNKTIGTDTVVGRLVGTEKNVVHLACECSSTRALSVSGGQPIGEAAAFDTAGYELQDDDRVFVCKQESDGTFGQLDGPWLWKGEGDAMVRPSDWMGGATIPRTTTHVFPVRRGNLWGGHHFWVSSAQGTNDLIIVAGDSTGSSWAADWGIIGPVHDVIDAEVTADASWTYTPRGCSSTNRCAAIVTGVIYSGDETSATIPSKTSSAEIRIPFESSPPTDDTGTSWETSSCTITRTNSDSTMTPQQGLYMWKFAGTSTTSTTRAYRYLTTLPAYHRAGIRCWLTKIDSSSTSTYARVRLSTDSKGNQVILGADTNSYRDWTFRDVTMSAGDVSSSSRNIYLQVEITGANKLDCVVDGLQYYSWFDVTDMIKAIDTRVYIAARYYPGTSVPDYLAGDAQQSQTLDATNFWGDDRLVDLTYSSACVLALDDLKINRFLKLSVRLEPVSELVKAPDLPSFDDEGTPAAYPY